MTTVVLLGQFYIIEFKSYVTTVIVIGINIFTRLDGILTGKKRLEDAFFYCLSCLPNWIKDFQGMVTFNSNRYMKKRCLIYYTVAVLRVAIARKTFFKNLDLKNSF